MSSLNIPEILINTQQICRLAGEFQLAHFRTIKSNQIEDKGLNQLVSFVDVETEKLLVSELSKLLPASGFVTEESTIEASLKNEYTWIIDPLDGTTNYLHGIPAWCISVALKHNEQIIIGVVYAPVWDEMFYAGKGLGAFLNKEPIAVTQIQHLSDSLLATGFPYYEFEYMEPYLQTLRYFMKNTHGLRRMGSAAIDMAYTACGRFDGFFELGLNAWDIAAGVLIVQEAGGIVSDFKGGADYLFGKSIIASNTNIFPELFQSINEQFKH